MAWEKKSFPSLTEWWDAGKQKIKILADSYTRRNKQDIKKEIHRKEKQLRNTQTKADRTGDARHARLASDLHNNIKILEKQAEGAKICSKAAFLEQNEKCSKYFFNLEKKRGQDKLIKAVKDPADRLVSDTADILTETKRFYENLYAAKETDPNAQEEMFAHIDKTLTPEQNEALAAKISKQEILEAITSMANGKSPGSDGLPPEFYKTFLHLLVDDLLEVYGDIFSNEKMSPTERLGLIALLYKKGDRTDFQNWHPISFLNTDYKILAKIFSKRLSKVLATIVDPDQMCAVPNRTILTNGLLLRDIIDLSNERGIPAALVCLDQLKAFDRVSWDFLFKTLIHFGFHPTFYTVG